MSKLIKVCVLTTSSLTEDCQADGCDEQAAYSIMLRPYNKRSSCHYCGTELNLCTNHFDEAVGDFDYEVREAKRVREGE